MTKIHRRALFGLLGASAATAVQAAPQAASLAGTPAFNHGVASGDPLADRVILWTRLDGVEGSANVAWEIAADAVFSKVIRKGRAAAGPDRDHTVKVDATGLKPATDYWYRFMSGSVVSPVGRTRTLPRGPVDEVVLGVVTCALYPGGLFNVYDAMAKEPRLDAIVHLGDYIYEYGAAPNDYGMGIGAKLGRAPDPPHEILTLADYRRRHAQYKRDPDLQAAHVRAAFICVYDDHETADNSYNGGAENHQPNEGDWSARKAAALKAYGEWMPIRDGGPGTMAEAIQRSFEFGDLASLIMVETRLQGRDRQLSYAEELPADRRSPADVAAFRAKLENKDRSLLGASQRQWLAQTLKRSTASGRVWQVIGNQVVMGRVWGPNFKTALGEAGYAKALAQADQAGRARMERNTALFSLSLPYNLDAWDGYPAERDRLYEMMTNARARPIVLSGDSHAFWVNDLKNAAGERVGAELGTSSVTSPSIGDGLPGIDLGAVMRAASPEVLLNDQSFKGYIRLTLRRDEATAALIGVSTITAKPYSTRTVGTVRIMPAKAGGLASVEVLRP